MALGDRYVVVGIELHILTIEVCTYKLVIWNTPYNNIISECINRVFFHKFERYSPRSSDVQAEKSYIPTD